MGLLKVTVEAGERVHRLTPFPGDLMPSFGFFLQHLGGWAHTLTGQHRGSGSGGIGVSE